jgi:hypothetical protein
MKKIIILCLLFVSLSSFLVAQEQETPNIDELTKNIVLYTHLNILSSFDTFTSEEGIKEMRKFSLDLSPFYKDLLYSEYSKNPWKVAGINLLTGGLGSILDGDILIGAVMEVGTIAAYTFMILGLLETDPDIQHTHFVIAEISGAVFAIAGIAWPFIDAGMHNKKLERALNM